MPWELKHRKSGWVVCQARKDGDEALVISPAFVTRDEAVAARDRMNNYAQYQGKELEVRYLRRMPKRIPKRPR